MGVIDSEFVDKQQWWEGNFFFWGALWVVWVVGEGIQLC